MVRNRRRWVKLDARVYQDSEFRQLGWREQAVWFLLLAYCGDAGSGGMIPESLAEIAYQMRLSTTELDEILTQFQRLKMVTIKKNTVSITKWGNHQVPRTDAERVRDHRQRKSAQNKTEVSREVMQQCNDNVTGCNVTPGSTRLRSCNGTVTGCNALEEKRREEIPEENKNTHTSNHTQADLRAHFDAFVRGTGHQLKWRHATHNMHAERLALYSDNPDQTEAVAKHYARSLSRGIKPSLPRFAADFDSWRAASEATEQPTALDEALAKMYDEDETNGQT